MKAYVRPRRPVPEQAAPPTPPLLGVSELLAELESFAERVAASPAPAAVTVVADFADDIAAHLRDLADLAGVGRPRGVFGPEAVAARTWHRPLAEVISAASAALGGRSARRRKPWDAAQRRFEAQQAIGRCRTALRRANGRLDTFAALEAAARRRHAELRPTHYKFERR